MRGQGRETSPAVRSTSCSPHFEATLLASTLLPETNKKPIGLPDRWALKIALLKLLALEPPPDQPQPQKTASKKEQGGGLGNRYSTIYFIITT